MRPLFASVLPVIIGMTPIAHAGTKPVAGMPDYNGTYYGTPNTGGDCDSNTKNCDSTAGRKMFSTLYRDNYNRGSGCAGEGCGAHAGVDIAVPSGTPVRAALGGKVVVSACKEGAGTGGTGGTIIIEATNPYATGKVYLVYAHLDDWNDYAVGSTVQEGAVIGKSGGKPGGACPGASFGEHLHFQVDKNPPDSSGRPWYPNKLWPTEGAEHADINFDVTRYTHNPLPFVTRFAYNFTFSERDNKELWGATNVTSYTSINSALGVDSSSANPYVGRSRFFGDQTCGESAPCRREITLDANIFKRLSLTLNFTCYTNPVVVYFRRGLSDPWHGAAFNYSGSKMYTISMGGIFNWNGIISDIIIEPSQGCTASPGPYEYYIAQMYLLP